MILLVSYDVRRRGGIERLSLQVRDGLRQAGHPCRLLSTRRLGPGLAGRLAGQAWFLLQLAWWLPRSQLVFSMHALLLRPIRLLQDLPGLHPRGQGLLCWLHGIEVWGANLPPLLADLRRCDGLAASSGFSRDQVRPLLGEQPPIAVIHPCAEAVPAEPAGDSLLGAQASGLAPPPGLRLLTVARMVRQERYKGHELILEALALLRQGGLLDPGLRWRVVGSGDDRPRLQERARALGLEAQIDWLGALGDGELQREYRDCSLVLMPSAFALLHDGTAQGEGFGITYLEAALAGRASIAADRGGQTDLIIDSQTGWLVPPEPQALADLLQHLQLDPGLVRACGERARQQAQRCFSSDLQRQRLARLVEPWLGAPAGALQGSSRSPGGG
ncbi:glycosyltransferase family 4 protein [Microcystis elabens FACHB-917]|nr:glycosyltransferase family 4 protein [Microcystis elabens FACHB-917]